MTLNPQQSALDRIKARFDDIAKRHHPSEVRDALDDLYAALCPPPPVDVAAEIEALKVDFAPFQYDDAEEREMKEAAISAIDRTAAIFQRELSRERMRRFGGFRAKGSSHTTACSIWGDDGQGHTDEKFEDSKDSGFAGLPCNCGALENFAYSQRQSAQPGSVERVEALTPEQSSVLVEAAELLDKAADYGGKNQSFGPYLPYIGASTKLRNLARTPATSDNEARVK